ncbi:hypothetical protein BKA70DRAFT_1138203 [Coprinopsis sp. MPI-PUGE-AT-0042]|nr:hypothetical protein BKA70DRAFT_1138203 [Coprinopsis sp. MPI-PUGE-AT-0042]
MALARGLLAESKFIDIASASNPSGGILPLTPVRIVNLTDPVFRGRYHGKTKHEDDLEDVMSRAKTAGVRSMIITGTSLKESSDALHLAKELNLYATVGCHPTRSSEFEKNKKGPQDYLHRLDSLISGHLSGPGRVVAVGECGLDYDRTHFATPEIQQKYFRVQLGLAKKYHLPLFLHSRAAHQDFVKILRDEGFGEDGGKAAGGRGGVVHSFTGLAEEAAELVSMGFYIGINGCSLKTQENLNVAKQIPINRLMLETDGPWCTMAATHASKAHLDTLPQELREAFFPPSVKTERFAKGKAVKGRNEPSTTGGVAWIMHCITGTPYSEVVRAAWENTISLFGLDELVVEAPSVASKDDFPPLS